MLKFVYGTIRPYRIVVSTNVQTRLSQKTMAFVTKFYPFSFRIALVTLDNWQRDSKIFHRYYESRNVRYPKVDSGFTAAAAAAAAAARPANGCQRNPRGTTATNEQSTKMMHEYYLVNGSQSRS